ncbi:beta-glucosidase A [Arthrobacter sp. Hiyo8]|nr:beta-glucosidase A [Arthrobacter sp. Hiyo8]
MASGRGDGTAHWNTPDMMAKLPFHLAAFPEYETTGFGWPVAPEHLGILLRELKDRYGAALPPLFITESGASFPEPDHTQGPVHDADRISYLASHLGQALRATAPAGSPTTSTFSATTSGRYWTTSNGPQAIRSGSAWCTLISIPSREPPRTRTTGTSP